jgi:flavin-binding protein dodecin
MADRTYRVTEVVGTSPDGVDTAIRNGLDRVGKTVRNLDWFEVTEIRGFLENQMVSYFQVGMKVGFRVEDPD